MLSLNEMIQCAIKEDIGNGDYTSMACVPETAEGKAKLLVKEKGIIAGVDVAKEIFNTIGTSLSFKNISMDVYILILSILLL